MSISRNMAEPDPIVTITTKSGAELRLRKLSAGDEGRLKEFGDSLRDETKRMFIPHSYDPEVVRAYIARCDGGEDAIFVALDPEERIVGYFFLWEMNEEVPVLGIGISDEYQGAGVGRQLMEFLINVAQRHGRSGVDLTTLPDNTRAFRLYKSVGFEYLEDVSNTSGDGVVVVERRMFLSLKAGAGAPDRVFAPPV